MGPLQSAPCNSCHPRFYPGAPRVRAQVWGEGPGRCLVMLAARPSRPLPVRRDREVGRAAELAVCLPPGGANHQPIHLGSEPEKRRTPWACPVMKTLPAPAAVWGAPQVKPEVPGVPPSRAGPTQPPAVPRIVVAEVPRGLRPERLLPQVRRPLPSVCGFAWPPELQGGRFPCALPQFSDVLIKKKKC